jgi:hypothetical protein
VSTDDDSRPDVPANRARGRWPNVTLPRQSVRLGPTSAIRRECGPQVARDAARVSRLPLTKLAAKCFTPSQALRIIRAALQGLTEMHERHGILHPT